MGAHINPWKENDSLALHFSEEKIQKDPLL